MVVCRKHNGEPRRTVDLKKLNDVSVRQTHPTQPPLQQAITVPHGQKKTVLDAWNGYHSVDIREEDRHLTNFLTPFGRYRYKSAPMGYMASWDAYTHRYNLVTVDVQNKMRVVDDTLLWQETIGEAFKHVAEYLTLCGRKGIILNPEKFTFSKDEVDWAGIRITRDKVEPLAEHVEAIATFPSPENLTDMKSYWALISQVAPYYSAQKQMLPFRELMKKATKWYWDATLQRLFEESRSIIAEKIKEGITRYDKDRWTALLTDWSRAGIGYIMTQKHCDCPGIHPLCCVAGWRVCMIGSSFLAPAETRYGAIEGECLGVVNALHKSRYYTMGCDKLIVCTDH